MRRMTYRTRRSLAAWTLGAAALAGATTARAALTEPIVGFPGPIILRPIYRLYSMNGTANADDIAKAVAVDSRDNRIAGGVMINANWTPRGTSNNKDWLVAKYSPAGALLWTRSLPGAFFDDEVNAVAVDGQDNVVAAGYVSSINNTGALTGTEFAVARWDAAGSLAWSRALAGTRLVGQKVNEAMAVTTDSQGNVLAAGYMTNEVTDAAGVVSPDEDFTVVKLNGLTGNEMWRKTIKGSRFAHSDRARAVAVDAADNVIAAGFVKNFGSERDIRVAAWNAAGTPLALNLTLGTSYGDDEAKSLTVDNQGKVVVAGFTTNRIPNTFTNDQDFWVAKCDLVTGLEWQDSLKGTVGGGLDIAHSVRTDSQRNVVAAGATTNTATGKDFTVMKWSPTGARLAGWPYTRNGAANAADEAFSVAVDSVDNIAAAGLTTGATSGADFTLAKLSPAGALIWSPVHNGSLNQDDQARAVVVDRMGWLVAVGIMRNGRSLLSTTPTQGDFTIAF